MILPSATEAEMKNGVTYKRTCTILTCSNTNPCCYFLKVLKMLLFFKSVDFKNSKNLLNTFKLSLISLEIFYKSE